MTKEKWMSLDQWATQRDDAELNAYDQKVEREKREGKRMTRRIGMTASAVAKGDPIHLNIAPSNLTNSLRHRGRKSDIERLLAACVDTPNEWYHRKTYYNEQGARNSQATYARTINAQGTNSAKDRVAQLVRALITDNGGRFEAQVTYSTEPTDAPRKGNYMHFLFVRWTPGVHTNNGSSDA